MNPELEQEVANLRALNLTPKQIARKLGLRPSEVTTIIQSQAQKLSLELDKKGELAPIAKCFANKNCIQKLLRSKSQDLADFENGNEDDLGFGNNGLGIIFVARAVSNRFRVCTYLVDYWCLGVKDAIGPYDNSNMIVRTLEQKLGANNFDYMFPVDGLEDRSLDW